MTEEREREPFLHLVPEATAGETQAWTASLEDEITGLREAMKTRGVIEQAKGMLMLSHGIAADEAFDVLVRWSSLSNVKLVRVATALVGICSGAESAGAPPHDLEQAVLAALAEPETPSA